MCALVMMVRGFKPPLSSLSFTSDQLLLPLLLSQPTFAPVFSVLLAFILSIYTSFFSS